MARPAARSPPCSASTCCTSRPGAWRKTSLPAPAAICAADGRLFVYGPFMRDGEHTAPSNAEFDASLRAKNPEWGVRDLDDLEALAQDAGLTLAETVPMPANNLVLAFARAVQQN